MPIILTPPEAPPTLPNVELPEPTFEVWEREFHAHPCECFVLGMFECGNEAAYRADVQCKGCDRKSDGVYLCAFHMDLREKIAFHGLPCGIVGLGAIFRNVVRIK